MKYTAIDPIIDEWAKSHSLTLYRSYKDSEVRSVDLVDVKGRRYQMWIDTPIDEFIAVHAWDYRKRRKDWIVKIEELYDCLENAFNTVREWFPR